MIKQLSPIKWFAVFLIIGTLLALVLPPDPVLLKILRISVLDYRLAVATLVIPVGVILFSAFYAYAGLQKYADEIKSTKEGQSFKKLANGVQILAWGLAIPPILAIILTAVSTHLSALAIPKDIFDNYLSMLVPLIGFSVISLGADSMARIARTRPGLIGYRILVICLITIGVIFAHFVIENSLKNDSPFHLSEWPLIFTIIIPYLYAWFMGLLGAYELWLYSRKVKGIIYKRVMAKIAGGITFIILSSISLEYLTSSLNSTDKTSFSLVLVILYLLLIIQAVGYGLVALGANRLQKIEEV